MRLLPEGVGEVKQLIVAPAARGRRLGVRLMGEMESIARGHGLSVLRLDTRLTPHELGHTAASLAISSWANVKAVQRMLGQASAR